MFANKSERKSILRPTLHSHKLFGFLDIVVVVVVVVDVVVVVVTAAVCLCC